MLAFRAVSARRLLGQAAALFGVGLTLAAAIRWGPPGWEGPWPLGGGMASVMSGPAAAATAGVAFLTLRADPAAAGAAVVLYRDGWRVGTLGHGPIRIAVRAGDTLSLRLQAPVRVRVDASGAVAAPLGGWTLAPTAPERRLPLVVLGRAAGGDAILR